MIVFNYHDTRIVVDERRDLRGETSNESVVSHEDLGEFRVGPTRNGARELVVVGMEDLYVGSGGKGRKWTREGVLVHVDRIEKSVGPHGQGAGEVVGVKSQYSELCVVAIVGRYGTR